VGKSDASPRTGQDMLECLEHGRPASRALIKAISPVSPPAYTGTRYTVDRRGSSTSPTPPIPEHEASTWDDGASSYMDATGVVDGRGRQPRAVPVPAEMLVCDQAAHRDGGAHRQHHHRSARNETTQYAAHPRGQDAHTGDGAFDGASFQAHDHGHYYTGSRSRAHAHDAHEDEPPHRADAHWRAQQHHDYANSVLQHAHQREASASSSRTGSAANAYADSSFNEQQLLSRLDLLERSLLLSPRKRAAQPAPEATVIDVLAHDTSRGLHTVYVVQVNMYGLYGGETGTVVLCKRYRSVRALVCICVWALCVISSSYTNGWGCTREFVSLCECCEVCRGRVAEQNVPEAMQACCMCVCVCHTCLTACAYVYLSVFDVMLKMRV
jgi:hypothetical protein